MAEEAQVAEVAEFGSWLDELEAEGEEKVSAVVAEAEEEAEEADEREAKKRKDAAKYITKDEYELEKLDSRFEASAPEEERELLAIYRRGDENPAQLKKLMQLVHTKVQEAHKKDEPDEDVVEAKAADIAAKRYGAGPIDTSQRVVPEDEWEVGRKRVREGDMHTAFAMFNALPGNGEVTSAD